MQPVFKLDITDLAKDLSEISELSTEQITENIFNDIGSQIAEKARENAPVRTGKLRNSISYLVQNGKLTIDVGTSYAMFQEFGTATRGEFPGRPYTIVPRNKQYLRFMIGGKVIYTKKATHPGVPARPYLRPAAIEVLGPLLDKLADRGQALIVKGPNSIL